MLIYMRSPPVTKSNELFSHNLSIKACLSCIFLFACLMCWYQSGCRSKIIAKYFVCFFPESPYGDSEMHDINSLLCSIYTVRLYTNIGGTCSIWFRNDSCYDLLDRKESITRGLTPIFHILDKKC